MRARLALATFVLICLSSAPLYAETGVAKANVNLRAQPSLHATIVGVLERDAEVRVLDHQGEFVQVERVSDGTVGFIRERMLTQWSEPKTEVVMMPGVDSALGTTTARVNLREQPATSSKVLEVLTPGVELRVLALINDYYQVQRESDGQIGFVAQRFFRRAHPDSELPVPVPVAVIDAPEVATPVLPDEPVVLEMPVADLIVSDSRFERDVPVMVAPIISIATSQPSPWYLSASMGYAQADVTAEELGRALRTSASVADVRQLDISSASWMLSAGYHFSPHWSAELGLLDLGSYDSSIDIRTADAVAVKKILREKHPVGGGGLRAALVGQHQIGGVTLSGSVGAFRSNDTQITVVIDGQKNRVDGENFSYVLDAGLAYRFGQHWSAQVFLSHLKLNQNLLNSGVRLGYLF